MTIINDPEHQPIRIMYIVSALNVGGAEIVLIDLINNLDRKKFTPILCVLYDGVLLNTIKDDVTVIKNIAVWRGDIFILSNLSKIIREQSPDIVDVFGRDLAGFYGRLAARVTGIKVIVQSLHSGEFFWKYNPIKGLHHVFNFICDVWTNWFILVSTSQRAYYQKIGIPSERAFVIINGVDSKLYAPSKQRDSKLLASLGIDESTSVIIQVANFSEVKRHDVLLKALSIVQMSFPDIYCLLIGDGILRTRMENLARSLNILENVKFIGSVNQVEQYLQIANIFTLTSDSESFSRAIVEAMCVGLPVISTRCGGPSEIVADQVTGFLIPPDEPELIAEKLLFLLQNPSQAQQMGRAGRQRALQLFSLNAMIIAREEFYATIAPDLTGGQ